MVRKLLEEIPENRCFSKKIGQLHSWDFLWSDLWSMGSDRVIGLMVSLPFSGFFVVKFVVRVFLKPQFIRFQTQISQIMYIYENFLIFNL